MLLKKVDPEEEDDDSKDEVKYIHRAIGSTKKTFFQGNLYELNFDLLGI
jgi:hypothetical protein